MKGDLVAKWNRFSDQWCNYERSYHELPEMSTRRRTAIFLAWTGTEAFQIFRKMKFEREEDRHDFDKVVEAFQRHCVGDANVRQYENIVRPDEVNAIDSAPGEGLESADTRQQP